MSTGMGDMEMFSSGHAGKPDAEDDTTDSITAPGTKTTEDSVQPRNVQCGLGAWRPAWLQFGANIQTFTLVLSLSSLSGTLNFTYYTAVITQIERHFGLSSSMTGFLKNVYNIGYLATVLIFSHLFRYSNKPRLFACCTIISSVAIFVFALPYFIYGTDDLPEMRFKNASSPMGMKPTAKSTEMCDGLTQTNTKQLCRLSGARAFNVGALVMFITSAVVQGIALSPKMTLSLTYMDDNAGDRSPRYFGCLFSVRALSPVIGFIIGAWTNRIYVDLSDPGLSPRDPQWIGAWWLGFVICAGISVIWAVPMLLFPPALRGGDRIIDTTHGESVLEKFKELPKAIARLASNKLYVLLVVALCLEIISVGFFTFVPKYLEQYFGVTASYASMLTGHQRVGILDFGTLATTNISLRFGGRLDPKIIRLSARIFVAADLFKIRLNKDAQAMGLGWDLGCVLLLDPTTGGASVSAGMALGPLIGSFMISLLKKVSPTNTLKMACIMMGLSALGQVVLALISCPESKWAGNINRNTSHFLSAHYDLYQDACAIGIANEAIHDYFVKTPQQQQLDCDNYSKIGFFCSPDLRLECNGNCSCDALSFNPICGEGINYYSPCHAGCKEKVKENGTTIYIGCQCVPGGVAQDGFCPKQCSSSMYLYIAVLFFITLFNAMDVVPNTTFFMRIVHQRDKAVAMGLLAIAVQLVAFPAPIAYGKLIDTTCLVLQGGCARRSRRRRGACLLYNETDLRLRMHVLAAVMKGLALLIYLVELYISKNSKHHGREQDAEKQLGHKQDIGTGVEKVDKSPE